METSSRYATRTRRCVRAAFLSLVLVGMWARYASPTEPIVESPRFCSVLRELLGAADGAFVDLRGAVRHGPLAVWDARLAIPGGTDCLVFGGSLTTYGCALYLGDDSRAADGAYGEAVRRVTGCLGPAWESMEVVTGIAAQTTMSRSGGGQVVRITSQISDAVGYLVHLWVDAQ